MIIKQSVGGFRIEVDMEAYPTMASVWLPTFIEIDDLNDLRFAIDRILEKTMAWRARND